MPPVLPRKRLRDSPPPGEDEPTAPPPKRKARAAKPAPTRASTRRTKENVFQTLDTVPRVRRTLSQTKALIEAEDSSSLSELQDSSSEEDFEDVDISGAANEKSTKNTTPDDESDEEDDEWEDALGVVHHSRHENEPPPNVSGDLEITLSKTHHISAYESAQTGKKGPSKAQKQARTLTHCLHVQFLMFHNLTRNGWASSKRLQRILVEGLSPYAWKEIIRYWRALGMDVREGYKKVVEHSYNEAMRTAGIEDPNAKASGKKARPSAAAKGRRKKAELKVKDRGARTSDRNQRDWGSSSERLEPNTPNLSSGDPLLTLSDALSSYFRNKFSVDAPSLRKRGYLPPAALEAEIKSWREDASNFSIPSERQESFNAFGERVDGFDAFCELAQKMHGSRDVGQQLFTTLLRALGIEARLVASLQPAGFGFSAAEEGKPKDLEKLQARAKTRLEQVPKSIPTSSTKATPGWKSQTNGTQATPITLSDSDSELSELESLDSDSDVGSPATTSKSRSRRPLSVNKKTGKIDTSYPVYWTEAISPLTHTPICISVFNRPTVCLSSNPERISEFYPKGAAKQVFCYILAFSSDGTAKDVTTRYLPKHIWPGRTRGFRMPVEKIPVHNKRGKVQRYEEWDWFKSAMRPYARPHSSRLPHDEVEDEGDLVPAVPEKKPTLDEKGGKESLAGYKASATYVLERHLRREEALLPSAQPVRHFTIKGRKGEAETSEPVYLREDIVSCKTVESWHKEGREVKPGEQPLKHVPMRAVTVTRKREIAEREAELKDGEKVTQGLYSKSQTDWIIPPPIVNGVIPRNSFGNIDVYVPSMVPAGAIHLPLKGSAKVCKKLGIDFAEACTGFEFGKQRAVPVITGVVVAVENEGIVRDAWRADKKAKEEKEQEKREKVALACWKRFYSKLKVVQRFREEHGDEVVEVPKTAAASATDTPMGDPQDELHDDDPEEDDDGEEGESHGGKKSEWEVFNANEDFEGGFLREDEDGFGGATERSRFFSAEEGEG